MTPPRARADASVLIIEDDPDYALMLRRELEPLGFEVAHAVGLEDAARALGRRAFDVALIDLRLQGESGIDALRLVRERSSPLTRSILMSALPAVPAIVEAMRQGAVDFLEKPIATDRLVALIERAATEVRLTQENELLKLHARGDRSFVHPDKLGPAIRGAFAQAVGAASIGGPVLLRGETGVGKELIARALHVASPRAAKPWIPLNCASLERALADSELFGHERGAFTGALERRLGLVEVAEGGTLFLDEIGDLPGDVQTKLLRFIDAGEYRRVGGTEVRHADVLLVAATNRDLKRQTELKAFRQDLLYRLEALSVTIAPLHDRPEDVPVLVEHFLAERGFQEPLPAAVMSALRSRSWPGNVRQLRNVLDRMLLRGSPAAATIGDVEQLAAAAPAEVALPSTSANQTLEAVELNHIVNVLERFNWNRTQAARALGVSTRTLYAKIRAHKLAPRG